MHVKSTRLKSARSGHTQGFTLIEIMIALLLSSIVLLTVFYVFVQNTEQYYRQEQVVQMQERMRFALEYVKNDLRNTGRLAMVNGRVPMGAKQTQGVINQAAVELFEDDIPAANLNADSNGLRPDRIRLAVDASGATPIAVVRVDGAAITVAPVDQQSGARARALLDPAARARFEAQYVPGYYVYLLHPPSGKYAMLPLDDVAFNAGRPTLDMAAGSPMDAVCSSGECTVNPVQMVEYAVAEDPDREDKTNLVRRRIDVRDDSVLQPEVIIAEYVVNLQLWGTYDRRLPLGVGPDIPADPDLTDTLGNWPAADEQARMNASPHRLRSMNVLLAVRTPREDPSFVQAPDRRINVDDRIAADRIWFEVNPAAETGYARVTTLVTEVETPNLDRGI
jgi:prepilin-type N-terminal cleavage/methylation domain-containing protein